MTDAPPPPDAATAERRFAEGVARHRAGDLTGAAACWRDTLRLRPGHPHAARNLAVALKGLGDWPALERVLRRLAAENPADAWIWFSLGVARSSLNRSPMESYRRALRRDPGHPESLWNLASLLEGEQRWTEAAALWRRAILFTPERAVLWRRHAVALRNARTTDAALLGASWRAVARLDPGDAEALYGVALHAYQTGRLDDAAEQWGRCRRLLPDHPGVLPNLAVCLKKLGRLKESEALFHRALALTPGDPDLRTNYALLALLTGRLAEGGRHWEARHDRVVPMDHYLAGRLPQLRRRPRWEGESDPGIHLFVHAEQGLGDTIQYIRFVEAARARVGRVTVAAQRPLMSLLAGCRGIDRLMLRDDPIPEDHTHYAALMSLPYAMGFGLDALAPRIPYLTPDPQRVAARRPPSAPEGRLRVGLVWSGNPLHNDDAARSIPPDRLAPLLDVPGVAPGSLQKGSGAILARMGWTERLPLLVAEDFTMDDTAALMESLDLVVTVDTAMAHLAGALGRPVWLLLPFAPDWRWLVDRADTPWYPTMRLFRQTARGDWPGVIGRVAEALASLAASRAETGTAARR